MCPGLFAVALSVIIKEWKQPKSPTVGKWLWKLLYIVTMEYCAIVRKMKRFLYADWEQLQDISLSERKTRYRTQFTCVLYFMQ